MIFMEIWIQAEVYTGIAFVIRAYNIKSAFGLARWLEIGRLGHDFFDAIQIGVF
jgi:hypothetical protein